MNFCTLFDSAYMGQGVCMIESLQRHMPDSTMVVFAYDDMAFDLLSALQMPNVIPVRLADLENEELLRIKPSRSRGEYAWTLTSSAILYAIEHFDLPGCTYIDADLFFFSSPLPLLEEMGEQSVLITPHNYYWIYDQSRRRGVYCVQFITFLNDACGLRVLRWWRDACIDWCFNRLEDGKFGDQKYLDEWATRFEGVHSLCHQGMLGPWNIQKYHVQNANGVTTVQRKQSDESCEAIAFHFHMLRSLPDGKIDLGWYLLDRQVRQEIYHPYLLALSVTAEKLAAVGLRVPAIVPSVLPGRIIDRIRWRLGFNLMEDHGNPI